MNTTLRGHWFAKHSGIVKCRRCEGWMPSTKKQIIIIDPKGHIMMADPKNFKGSIACPGAKRK